MGSTGSAIYSSSNGFTIGFHEDFDWPQRSMRIPSDQNTISIPVFKPTARSLESTIFRWYPSAIRKIISNSACKGELLYQQTERVKGEHGRRTKTRLRPESDWMKIPVPRIIPDIVWDRAQARLHENRVLSKRNVKRNYLLRGLIFCPECGSKLAGKARSEKCFYRCNNVDKIVGSRVCTGSYIPADQVEQVVWEAVSESLKNPELLVDQYRQQLADSSVADEFELNEKQIALAIKRVVVQEDRMTDAYRNEAIDLDRYKSEMNQLNTRRNTL